MKPAEPREWARIGVWLPISLFIGVAATRTITHQILFADGAYFDFNLISLKLPYFVSDRAFVEWVQQFPAYIIRNFLPYKNTKFVTYGLGFGYYFTPAIILSYCVYKSRYNPKLYLLNLIVGYLSFILATTMVGESGFTSILVLLYLNILILKIGPTALRSSFLFFTTLLLLKSYESMIFLGPILIFATFKFIKLTNQTKKNIQQCVEWFTIASLFMGTFLASKHLLFPRDISNRSSAFQLKNLMDGFGVASAILIPLIATGLGFLFNRIKMNNELYFFCWSIMLAAITVYYLIGGKTQLAIGVGYNARLILALLTGISCFSYLITNPFKTVSKPTHWRIGEVAVVCILILSSAQSVNSSVGWSSYMIKVQQTLHLQHGVISYSTLGAGVNADRKYSWAWSMPALSLMLRQETTDGVMSNPGPASFNPIDPSKPQSTAGYFWN